LNYIQTPPERKLAAPEKETAHASKRLD